MQRIALVGGGRWSRVLVSVLSRLLTDRTQLIWVTRHGRASAEKWAISNSQQVPTNLRFSSDESDLCQLAVDGVIIANSSHLHASTVRSALELEVPVLCEKPLALELGEAKDLVNRAADLGCPLGIGLEYLYASYLHEFSRLISQMRIESVELTWHDPFSEVRYGELKYGDIYTSLVHDAFPHCWSILSVLAPNAPLCEIQDVQVANAGEILIAGLHAGFCSSVALSRRAPKRVRKVSINAGEAVLDFSTEPGTTFFRGETSQNHWSGERPLNASLSSFLEMREPWLLSADRNLGSIEFTSQANRLAECRLRELLVRLEDVAPLDPADPSVRDLLIDLYLPIYAAAADPREARLACFSDAERSGFAKSALQDWLSVRS